MMLIVDIQRLRHTLSISKANAQIPCSQNRIAIGRYGFHAVGCVSKRNVADSWGIERNHDPRFSLFQSPYRRGAKTKRNKSVERGRRSAAKEMPEHNNTSLFSGEVLELMRDRLADSSKALCPS